MNSTFLERDTLAGADTAAVNRLRLNLSRYEALAIAVSGGVDSITLAAVACEVLGDRASIIHATSPAVPLEATERVRHYASTRGWALKVVDAGEFGNANYLGNPIDRCYYCKSNLYARIREVWDGPVASGANLDDLGDYRPGLLAAKEKEVVHPLVDASINKATVRKIAASINLELVAELPAQPCLSSRIETGIAIDVADLSFVHKVENMLVERLGEGDIRCRITAIGVRIEVAQSLQDADKRRWVQVQKEVSEIVKESNRSMAGFSGYTRGSAFLKDSVFAKPIINARYIEPQND